MPRAAASTVGHPAVDRPARADRSPLSLEAQRRAGTQGFNHRPPNVRHAISLYTGAGGLDLGFEAAGVETRVAVEMDRDAVATLRMNRPSWALIPESIQSVAAASTAILQAAGLREGDADLLIGGPPCQPFSKSGYWARGDAKRLADPRAETLVAYLRVLRDTKPRAFLLENVPGLTFSAKDEGLVFLAREIDRLNREHRTRYSFHVALLRAVEFGVPQDRQRVFIIGSREGTDFTFPGPTHMAPRVQSSTGGIGTLESFEAEARALGLQPFRTAWDAIGDLEDDDDPELAMTGKWAALLPSIPEGRNYLFHTARGIAEGGKPLFGWRRRYWNFLLKLSKQLPSWTIAAQPGPATGPFHWKNRRLSARELMRLQTFPEGYRIAGNLRAAQRQVGNAVPSALAEKLALEIRRQLLGEPHLQSEILTLLPPRRRPTPPPERVRPVSATYRALAGDHEAHPGTGQGYSAQRRGRSSS
ncbi:MAG: DNA cytosine methyltransferase [Acidobacteria bacterium]|nr:DNA cytosine methyltransferase [Acidobacteriota bacterium]